MKPATILKQVMNEKLDIKTRLEALAEGHDQRLFSRDDYRKFLTVENPLVRFMGATHLGARFNGEDPQEVIPFLQEGFKNYEVLAKEYNQSGYSDADFLMQVVWGFSFVENFNKPIAYGMLKHFLVGFEKFKDSSEDLVPFLDAIFALTFSDCELPFAPDFILMLQKIEQVKILEIYQEDTEVLSAFETFGLPNTQEDLKELLIQLAQATDPFLEMHSYMHGPHDYQIPQEDDVVVSAIFIPKNED